MLKKKRDLYVKILYYALLFSLLIGPITTYLQNMAWKEVSIGGVLSPLMIIRGGLLVVFIFILYHMPFVRGKNFKLIYPLLFICIYVVLTSALHPYPLKDFIYVFRILYLCIVFIVAYSLTTKNVLNIKHLQIVALIIILVMFISQLIAFKMGIVSDTYKSNYAVEGFTGGASRTASMVYMVLPVFLLIPRWTKLKIIAITLGCVSVLITMRRTGLGAIMILLFVDNTIKVFSKGYSKKVKLISVIVPMIAIISFWVALVATDWGVDFQRRLMDLDIENGGTGSGRTEFQAYGIERILNRGLTANILGDGFGFSLDYLAQKFGVAIFFHSDWLEIAVAAGVVVLAAYILFWINLFGLSLKIKKYHSLDFNLFIASVLMLLFVSAVSGGTFRPVVAMLFTLWGYVAAQSDFTNRSA